MLTLDNSVLILRFSLSEVSSVSISSPIFVGKRLRRQLFLMVRCGMRGRVIWGGGGVVRSRGRCIGKLSWCTKCNTDKVGKGKDL